MKTPLLLLAISLVSSCAGTTDDREHIIRCAGYLSAMNTEFDLQHSRDDIRLFEDMREIIGNEIGDDEGLARIAFPRDEGIPIIDAAESYKREIEILRWNRLNHEGAKALREHYARRDVSALAEYGLDCVRAVARLER